MAIALTAAIIRSLFYDATTSLAGWKSSGDKTKLNGIAYGGVSSFYAEWFPLG